MSIADYTSNDYDYCDIYNDDCDNDCKNCPIRNECEESTEKE